jgi:putative hydrolase of the HAD superfamily
VNALLFDFGGTLDADGVPWKERFFRLWKDEGEEVSREEFDRAFYAADDALVGALPATLPLAGTAARLARGIAAGLRTGGEAVPARVAERFYGNLAAVCREAGIGALLSAAVDSADVGCSKPDAAIFRAALDELGKEASETVFVGDSFERDMAGARGVGMRHVLLAGDFRKEPRCGCCPGDPVIRRLADLEALL